jgi:hypothetical protein
MPQQFMSMAAQKPGVEGEAAAAAALSPGGGVECRGSLMSKLCTTDVLLNKVC